jgi:hypothetical protein
MISVQQAQIVLDAIRAQNALVRRHLVARKQRDTRALETKYERPVFEVPGLDEVLAGTEREAEELVARYRL